MKPHCFRVLCNRPAVNVVALGLHAALQAASSGGQPVAEGSNHSSSTYIACKHTPYARVQQQGPEQIDAEVKAAVKVKPVPLVVVLAGSRHTDAGGEFSISRYAGEDLLKAIKRKSWQDKSVQERIPDTLTALVCMALGLQHIHASGLLHRDLKLENAMVHRRSKLVQVADHGLAVRRDKGDFFSGVTWSE